MADLFDSMLARIASLERASGGGGGGVEVEPGRFIFGGWDVAPDGYLMMGTTVTGGAALHAALAAMFPSWVVGADLVLPSVDGASIIGEATDPAGVVSGSMTLNLTVAQLPEHNHANDHDHEPFDTAADEGDHVHDARFLTTATGSGSNANLARPHDFSFTEEDQITLPGDGDHIHEIDVPPYIGNTGMRGDGDPIDITGRNMTVRVAVKT